MTNRPVERDRALAMRRGFLCKCPHCGEGRLFDGYLTVVRRCSACEENFTPYRAADGPAFFTVTLVGLLLIPVIGWYFVALRPDPLTMAVVISVGLTVVSLGLLRFIKGAVIGFMWAEDERDRGA
ncbi:DUF983 domain-containing protein [Falsirhodobacter xinxiangensis]|uniref:DUF983 domain-containing protein n=1 Tax=Falsirhodobacter xinxiangensis TaxID=2530049 RepID=UPI0010AB01E1|nr:DUF983 domain-containing protein [Rhodobacter xinxiangensis]